MSERDDNFNGRSRSHRNLKMLQCSLSPMTEVAMVRIAEAELLVWMQAFVLQLDEGAANQRDDRKHERIF